MNNKEFELFYRLVCSEFQHEMMGHSLHDVMYSVIESLSFEITTADIDRFNERSI